MQNVKILELLELGRIAELKSLIRDEIYMETLDKKSNSAKRYKAMQMYVKNSSIGFDVAYKEIIKYEVYYCFIDFFSAVITKENIGNIEIYDEEKPGKKYINIPRLFTDYAFVSEGKVDLHEVFARVKSAGFKLNNKLRYIKKEDERKCLIRYKEAFYDASIVHKAFSIIDDNEDTIIQRAIDSHFNDVAVIALKTSIGRCLIMPIRVKEENRNDFVILDLTIKEE